MCVCINIQNTIKIKFKFSLLVRNIDITLNNPTFIMPKGTNI